LLRRYFWDDFASMMKSVDTACRAGARVSFLSTGSRVPVPSLTLNSYLGLIC
jgi:hypothetical protein